MGPGHQTGQAYKNTVILSGAPHHAIRNIRLAHRFSASSSLLSSRYNCFHGARYLCFDLRLLGVPPPLVDAGRRRRRKRRYWDAVPPAPTAAVLRRAEAAEDEALHPPEVHLHAPVLAQARPIRLSRRPNAGPVFYAGRRAGSFFFFLLVGRIESDVVYDTGLVIMIKLMMCVFFFLNVMCTWTMNAMWWNHF